MYITMICLLFVAVVTPVEVGFTTELEWWSPLFTINRVVDLVFLFDLLLQVLTVGVSAHLL